MIDLKKGNILLLFFALLFLPTLGNADFETSVEAGDIVLWWNPIYEVPVLGRLLTLPWDLWYGTYTWQHSDTAIDDDGTVRTSIQNKGVSNSTISNRFESFTVGCLIRNDKLTEDEIDEIVDKAWETEGDYDYGGYQGTVLDTLLFLGRGNFFVILYDDPDLFYCSETTNYWCNLGIEYPSPLDIYYHATYKKTDWNVLEVTR